MMQLSKYSTLSGRFLLEAPTVKKKRKTVESRLDIPDTCKSGPKRKRAPKQLSNSAAPLVSPLIGKIILCFSALVQFILPVRPGWLFLPTGACRACLADRLLTLITAQSPEINPTALLKC